MFVKRLELIGFKSFADRADLEVAPGVTAVMGPNGSGKSNIADAIRWVLGEQSIRLLRGARLEDVIFAGSDVRKPVNYAEVRLLFDNADHALPIDYAEVAVARRVYRSGESEFFINQTACRLKDITELFMDTGMGREAYSVIGQGRIEEILSNKPEERRGIFEEAAGIVKFKVRRREAEKKLADADLSLLRVRDLIAELSLQLEPLEKRSQVAQVYKQVLAAAERLSAAVLSAEFDQIHEKNHQLVARIDEAQRETEAIIAGETAAESELIRLRALLEESERDLQRVQADRLDATAKVEKNEGDLRVHAERRSHLDEQSQEGQRLAQRLEDEINAAETELDALFARKTGLEQTADGLRSQLKRHQEERAGKPRLQQLRGELAEARSQMIELMREQAAERNEWHNAEQWLAQQQRRLERVRLEQETAEVEAMRLLRLRDGAASELQAMQSQLLLLEKEREQSHAEWQRALEEQKALQQKAGQIEKTRLELNSRLRALQGMHETRQGFASGPKAVLNAVKKRQLGGVIGAVADLFKVGKDWETAVETALGGSLQNVVTDTEASARACIAHLKKNNLGRATFLPLSVLAGRTFSAKERALIEAISGFVGVASELVEIEPKLVPVAEFLLGQVLVVTDLEVANVVAAKLHHRYRIVTRDGDVVHPGGSMTGGSQSGRGSGLLAINRGMEELATELEGVDRQWEGVRQELAAAQKQVQDNQQQWRRDEERYQQLERTQRERDNEWRIADVTYRKQAENAEALVAQATQLALECEDSLAKKNDLQQKVAAIEQQAAGSEVSIRDWERQIAEEEARQEEHQDEWTEWRVQLAECEEALRSVEAARVRQEQERSQLLARKQQTLASLAELQARMEDLGASGLRLEAEQTSLHAQLALVEQSLARALAERQARADASGVAEVQVQSVRAKRRQKEAQVHELQLALGKYSVELETKENELREKHGLGIELARNRFPLDQPLAQAREELARLRTELQRFDGVNLGDIEEYESQRERHQFLTDEEADLQQAQTQLRELIAEMDAEMGKRFRETFTQVRNSFQEVFRDLFGGGRADLRLEGAGDPLLDGIDILAEPPGKKLQMLSLLSGGERALTALALLFAILKVKPVPFCVLDEVEAALDEVNVVRFAEFLKQFSAQTQFIVITHRRGTMEAADVLYGVTMQETGVSRLVSVRVVEEQPATA